jgi:hypothetical protein
VAAHLLLMGLERALDRLQQGNRHRRKRSRMVLASPGLLLDHEMKYPQRPAFASRLYRR